MRKMPPACRWDPKPSPGQPVRPAQRQKQPAAWSTASLARLATWSSVCLASTLLAGACALAALERPEATLATARPWVIAHRGASGSLPEHTLEAYRLAISQGADFIECDVVFTSDCAPVCRHEPLLSETTNADQLFPERATVRKINAKTYEGVFASDLTLAEVQQLRARQAQPQRSQVYNDLYKVPTLEEYLDLALAANRTVGVYPEVKHPTWHDAQQRACMGNVSVTERVLQALQDRGYEHAIGTPGWLRQPAFIQSFEVGNLRWLATRTQLPLIQLLDPAEDTVPDTGATYGAMMSDAGLDAIAQYAAGIGPHKRDILGATHSGKPGWRLIERAHARGLQVHPFTFRDDAKHLDVRWAGHADREARHFLGLGIDAAFTDFPGTWAPLVSPPQGAPDAKLRRRPNERPLEDLQEM